MSKYIQLFLVCLALMRPAGAAEAPPAVPGPASGGPAARPDLRNMVRAMPARPLEVEVVVLRLADGVPEVAGLEMLASRCAEGFRIAHIVDSGESHVLYLERFYDPGGSRPLRLPDAVNARPEQASDLRATLMQALVEQFRTNGRP